MSSLLVVSLIWFAAASGSGIGQVQSGTRVAAQPSWKADPPLWKVDLPPPPPGGPNHFAGVVFHPGDSLPEPLPAVGAGPDSTHRRTLIAGPGVDTDGDGLTDLEENTGWFIAVDRLGYGPDPLTLEVYLVTSNPMLPDTDSDGLPDWQEFLIKTDPNKEDTDGDHVPGSPGPPDFRDLAEFTQHFTNPNSVDTDGDAILGGNGIPNAAFFDGAEELTHFTSPTLADTDGDGRSDPDEVATPTFSQYDAELPQLKLTIEGDVEVLLNVEYAELMGSTKTYGHTFTHSQFSIDSTTGSSASHKFGMSTLAGVAQAAFGAGQIAYQYPPAELSDLDFSNVTGGLSKIANSLFGGSAGTHTHTSGQQSSSTSIDLQSDQHTHTETASSGTISLAVRVENTGDLSVTLHDMGITALRLLRDENDGSGTEDTGFQAVATLTPQFNALTLGPGEASSLIQVSSDAVNTDVVKDVLAHPRSLIFEPASVNLLDANGLDYDFITEVTHTRTALIEIDYGDGTFARHRIATNVERDGAGNLIGIKLEDALQRLDISYVTHIRTFFDTSNCNPISDPAGVVQVLAEVEGVQSDFTYVCLFEFPPNSWWSITGNFEGVDDPDKSFDDITLRAGEHIYITYHEDLDEDLIPDPLEEFYAISAAYGTPQAPDDFDGDGLSDYNEIIAGWTVDLTGPCVVDTYGYPKKVFSDPVKVDTDGDGLSDLLEDAMKCDPTHRDTDRDGLTDDLDPEPTTPGRRLFVDGSATGAGDGSTWADAYPLLSDALFQGFVFNDDPDGCLHVTEIWVARGLYLPSATADITETFSIPRRTQVYGGFYGVEQKLAERDPSPYSGQTILWGDVGASFPTQHVVTMLGTQDFSVLDGFLIAQGDAAPLFNAAPIPDGGGVLVQAGGVQLRNLVLASNHALHGGGVSIQSPGSLAVEIENCDFFDCHASDDGGGLSDASDLLDEITGCSFVNCTTEDYGGGAITYRAKLTDCVFTNNGGGLSGTGLGLHSQGGCTLISCDFTRNGGILQGGAASFYSTTAESDVVINCRFWDNHILAQGGAVYVASAGVVYFLNCTFANNDGSGSGAYVFSVLKTVFDSCIFWGNTGSTYQIEGTPFLVQNCTLQGGLGPGTGTNNLESDPFFVDAATGNLRLQSTSESIDSGVPFGDADPDQPGLQPLPDTDLDGNPRVANGQIDRGAYEHQ